MLVHGFATSTELTWRSNGWLDLIADAGREAVGVDLPGHGDQPKPHDPAAYAAVVDDVERRLPDGPLDAIGYSQGSTVVLRLASRDPGRFRRIVLTGAGESVFARSPGSDVLARALAGELDLDAIPADERVILDHFISLAREAPNDPLALAAFMRRPHTPLEPEDLAAIDAPVLVLIGEHDFAGPPDRLVDSLPHATLKVVPRVDHFNAPKDFAVIEAALDFLDAQPF